MPYMKLRPPESALLMQFMHLSPLGVRYRRPTSPQSGHCPTGDLFGGFVGRPEYRVMIALNQEEVSGGEVKACRTYGGEEPDF